MRSNLGESPSESSLNRLLGELKVDLDAFAMCEIADGCGISFPAWDKTIVHYVIQGEGSIQTEHRNYPISRGMIVIIPKGLAKQLNGPGPLATTSKPYEPCALTPGIVKVGTCRKDEKNLVLGCASISDNLGEGLDLFGHFREPLIESTGDEVLMVLFQAILRELSKPGTGTKALVEASMKQILILLLRQHLSKEDLSSPVHLPLADPQLGPALTAMLTRPQDPHCIDSLAELAGMSRSSFVRRFTGIYSTSVMDYLHSIRMIKSSKLLGNSSLPVKAIAMAVGFASRSHFSRAFRARFGVDPTAFRGPESLSRNGEER